MRQDAGVIKGETGAGNLAPPVKNSAPLGQYLPFGRGSQRPQGRVWRNLAISLTFFSCQSVVAETRTGTASWYSYSSARREGNSGVMANGYLMQDAAFTAASWNYPFGSRLRICRVDQGSIRPRCVDASVTDRGPSKRLYRQGRILDLSPAAFRALAPLEAGVIKVSMEEIR